MAGQEEILDALADYATRCNGNEKLRRMLENWSRLVHFRTLDTGEIFTVSIKNGQVVAIGAGTTGEPPDLVVSATSEDLCDMFWGDLNPARKYLTGEIAIQGAAADVMRIDAMASLIWAD